MSGRHGHTRELVADGVEHKVAHPLGAGLRYGGGIDLDHPGGDLFGDRHGVAHDGEVRKPSLRSTPSTPPPRMICCSWTGMGALGRGACRHVANVPHSPLDSGDIALGEEAGHARASQGWQAGVDAIAQAESVERLGDDAGDPQEHEDRSHVAGRANAEVATDDQHVPGFDLFHPARPVGGEAVLELLAERHQDRVVRDDKVGVDVVAEPPDPSLERRPRKWPDLQRLRHQMSLGSVMTPVTAEAATVAGEPIKTLEVGLPIRPLKFRVDAVMQTSSSASRPM